MSDARWPARRPSVPWLGVAAGVGAALVVVTPWIQTARLGSRPYAATAFDAASLAGWLLLGLGAVGVFAAFGDRFGPAGRLGVGLTGAGTALVAALQLRRVGLFVAAGFRAVPATGEDPAGLVLSLATVLGLGLAVLGTGLIGVGLGRVGDPPTATARLALLAPTVPLAAVALDAVVGLPLALGRLAVGSNALLVPFGLAWLALGATLWTRARRET